MLLFRLNMKILTDAFSDKYAQVTLFSDQDRPCLEAVRPWQKDRPLEERYLYALPADKTRLLSQDLSGFSFLVAGKPDTARLPSACSVHLKIKS